MKLITITGPSGAGKDTVAQLLADALYVPVIVSYTTRPMRDGEEQGREHYFVEKCDVAKDEMLAYTEYGGYEYWTTVSQIGEQAIYVIDEKGLIELHDKFPDIELVTIHVTATEAVRRERGVTAERMERDLQRQGLPADYYDYRISNNKSVKALKHKIRELAQCITI